MSQNEVTRKSRGQMWPSFKIVHKERRKIQQQTRENFHSDDHHDDDEVEDEEKCVVKMLEIY